MSASDEAVERVAAILAPWPEEEAGQHVFASVGDLRHILTLANHTAAMKEALEEAREALRANIVGSEALARHYKIDLCNDVENGSAYHKSRVALAKIDAALSASPVGEGWQPIESAPRDGTEILVCVTHNLPDDQWETKIWVDWWYDDGQVWNNWAGRIDIPFQPTHWRPLPDPPAMQSGKQGG